MAATVGHFKSVGIAEESGYGSLSSGAVDASGLTFTSFDCDATLTTLPAENPADDDIGTRDGDWRRPPIPNAPYDISNSRWKQRGEGTFTLTGYVDPIGSGSGITDYDDHPLWIILGTRLAKLADPASASEQVAGSSSANILTATTASLYTEGAIIGHTLSGKFRFAQVVDKSSNDITHSPALNASGLAITNVVRFYRTGYIPKPGQSPDVESFAVRLDAVGMRFYAVGCVWTGNGEFTETEGGRLKFSLECESPYIYADHGNAALDPVDYAGEVYAHRSLSPVIISDAAAGTSAPYTLGRVDLDPVPGTVRVAFEGDTARTGFAASGLPYKLKPVSTRVSFEMVIDDPSSTIATDYESRTQRTVAIGFGPQIAGAGVCFFMPRAHLTASAANRDAPDGGVVQQSIAYRPGEPHAVNDANEVAFSPFLLALGL